MVLVPQRGLATCDLVLVEAPHIVTGLLQWCLAVVVFRAQITQLVRQVFQCQVVHIEPHQVEEEEVSGGQLGQKLVDFLLPGELPPGASHLKLFRVVDSDSQEPVSPPGALRVEESAVVDEGEGGDDEEEDEPEPIEDKDLLCYSVCGQQTQVVFFFQPTAGTHLLPLTHSHPGEDIGENPGPVDDSLHPTVAQLVELPVEEYFHQEEIDDDIEDIEDLAHHEGHGVLDMTPAVVVLHDELGHVVHHDLSLLQVLFLVLGFTAGYKILFSKLKVDFINLYCTFFGL